MTYFSSSFIGSFKLGDNINHNLEILKKLYSIQDSMIFNKIKTVLITSIIEAILHDLFFRAKFYTREGVKNISIRILQYIKNKKLDKFDHYIKCAKKHELFGPSDNKIYTNLDKLRKLRNRIHIQNESNDFESDEKVAFSTERRILAEKTLEKILHIMSTNYDRGHNYVNDFYLPWE